MRTPDDIEEIRDRLSRLNSLTETLHLALGEDQAGVVNVAKFLATEIEQAIGDLEDRLPPECTRWSKTEK